MEETCTTLWIRCPLCGGKTNTKVYPDTVLLNFPLSCPECNQETKVNVVKLKMVVSDETDDKAQDFV
jgi:hypothetical protein